MCTTFCGLNTMAIIVDTWIHGFLILERKGNVLDIFWGSLIFALPVPTKCFKFSTDKNVFTVVGLMSLFSFWFINVQCCHYL